MFSLVAWSHRCGLYHWDGRQHEAISGEHHSTCQGGVCSFVPVLAFMFITCISSTSVDFYCVTDGVITATAYVKQFCSPCILCQRNSLFDMHLNSVAVWPDHSHLPAAAVKEAEGQACPPAPWTNSLWGLLLSTAPGNTGQTWDHNSQKALFLFWAAECLYNCMFWFTLYDSTLHLACLLFPSSPWFFCRSLIFFPPLTCRLGTPFTSARMKTQWLSVLSTFAQSTLMTVRGFQAHNTHPRGSEVSQMDLQTTKTWYVKAGKNVFLQPSLSLD